MITSRNREQVSIIPSKPYNKTGYCFCFILSTITLSQATPFSQLLSWEDTRLSCLPDCRICHKTLIDLY